MNRYIPNEVRDLTRSKQRVMQNVLNDIENKSRKPNHNLRSLVISAALIMSALLFVLNQAVFENALQPATEQSLDLTEPALSYEQGTLYLHELTLGDSQSKVIELLGEDYTIEEEASGANLIMNYGDKVRFYFKDDQVASMVFMNVNEDYFDRSFNDYDGFKFFLSMPTAYDGRFIYSEETNQVLNASLADTDGNIQLSLYHPGSDLREIAEYLFAMEKNIKKQHQPPNIDLAKPEFFVEDGKLFFHGVTLGDSPEKVIEQMGDNYLIGKVDSGEETDFVMEYDSKVSFIFLNDKVDLILFKKVDKSYFDQLYDDYDGFKFLSSPYEADSDRYFYSEETKQALKATTNVPHGDLYISISYPDPNFWEHPEMKDVPNIWE